MAFIGTKLRLRILLIIIVFITITLIGRVIYLSSIDPADFMIREGKFTIQRGEIVDRNYKMLAVSDELVSIYANPNEIKGKEETARKLALNLELPYTTLVSRLERGRNFVWLERQVSPARAEKIKSLKLKGIYFSPEFKRFYPNKNLASHILGFCNIDNKGTEGIEKQMDNYLLNTDIKSSKITNNKGLNIQLTIDANIQAIAEKVLAEGVEREKAASASLLLVDGISGEILAMANSPDFNPNKYNTYSQRTYRNSAIFNLFEPGSVFKIFTMAALLDNENIDQDTVFHCDGQYDEDNFSINCTGVHGDVNVSGVFKYSCNDGTLQGASLIPDYEFYHYLKSFGFGEKVSIDLPGEQGGLLRIVDNWTARSMLSIPIGQEIGVNSLQMVQAATTFLNDGVMVKPRIVKKIYDRNNRVVNIPPRQEVRRVISPGVSAIVLDAMTYSTTEGGTVSKLKIDNLYFNAKSGTAEIYDSESGQYSETDFTSSLLTLFPAANPRYISYIVYNRPKGDSKWGGEIGAYLLNDFIGQLTGYLNIYDEDALINEKNISINREYEKITELPAEMPDFKGFTGGDVLDVFSQSGLKVELKGRGRVYRQSPESGTPLKKGSVIKIYLKE